MAINGSGLGLRRGMLDELSQLTTQQVDFFEVAPENWIGLGGRFGKAFRALTERFPFACHGLSLSIGSSDPLDITFVKAVKQFLDTHQIETYSEHLSYCSHNGHMYDLLPIPFTQDAIDHVVSRVQHVQDILQRPLILENVSTYAKFGEMDELTFTQEIVKRSGCQLLLDVNNVYVNSINHHYDPIAFIKALPSDAITYMHIAGHFDEADDLKVDTHGAPVKDDVWQLLRLAYDTHGVRPTLLERDFNFPPIDELLSEVNQIKTMQEVDYA
ncbi:HvfB family MNIO-type RiPP peptide maturase [Pseudomonas sp. HK3]|jgi:uncharacterized protein (UPF0276 family)